MTRGNISVPDIPSAMTYRTDSRIENWTCLLSVRIPLAPHTCTVCWSHADTIQRERVSLPTSSRKG